MIVRALLGTLLTLSLGTAYAASLEAGKQKSAVCQSCHGEGGNSANGQFPRLAGQYPDYLVQALLDYQNGARKNPIMAPFAQNLTRTDMEDLAAYFASSTNGLIVKP